MSSIIFSPLVKEEVICWTEKEALGLNIVVKEEKEEEDVTVKQEVEGDAVTVKEEEKDAFRVYGVKEEEDFSVKEKEEDEVFGVEDEEGEITVTLEEDEEERAGDLINTSKYSYISCVGEPLLHLNWLHRGHSMVRDMFRC
ncbi:proline-, glutamic acid- and leucine-rich protein 1-like isoform X2 [Salvelinus fontinalis]|uniref:proline-, glutamic acid- and leucine-rich protein 1-like isoform X2 n=1 Tax=Salvelinus fontinalis TaxID=8038 RepID=UPI002484E9EB|nr:proline-, glutamic acid- and leucine-rich protein 1-like isoform X2 [Salvelinus fontinalis]